jgi:hypothetical protein
LNEVVANVTNGSISGRASTVISLGSVDEAATMDQRKSFWANKMDVRNLEKILSTSIADPLR